MVLIYVNKEKDIDGAWYNLLCDCLKKEKIEYQHLTDDDFDKKIDADAIFVLGGDGTILALTEFSVKNEALANDLDNLLQQYDIFMKKTQRGTATVLYTKDSSMIEDLLTLMGDTNRTLEIMDAKIMKSVKNKINRQRNCDNANITKTVEASLKQRKAIEYLEKADRLYSLPQELLDAALLRKNNPEATLKELCKISPTPITVSGLNHRFNRIIEIFEEMQ